MQAVEQTCPNLAKLVSSVGVLICLDFWGSRATATIQEAAHFCFGCNDCLQHGVPDAEMCQFEWKIVAANGPFFGNSRPTTGHFTKCWE